MKYFILFLLPLALFAHRLNLVVYDNDSSISIKGYYSGNSKCKACKVKIKADGYLKEFTSSDEGIVDIKKSELPKGEMMISIDAGDGHFEKMSYKLGSGNKESEAKDDHHHHHGDHHHGEGCCSDEGGDSHPKHTRVQRSRPEIRALDVGAALGYIVGIFGIVAFIMSRKKPPRA